MHKTKKPKKKASAKPTFTPKSPPPKAKQAPRLAVRPRRQKTPPYKRVRKPQTGPDAVPVQPASDAPLPAHAG